MMLPQTFKRFYKKSLSVLLRPAFQYQESQQIALSRQMQILLACQYQERFKQAGPALSFEDIGFNVYSSDHEDGILHYIFAAIGMETRQCVDIGAGTIEGSNTANLIINHGFSALLIDGNRSSLGAAREFYANQRETRAFPPVVAAAMVTAENINKILSDQGYAGEIDLLSIDIDGMDYWIWKAITAIQPRVVVVEYQDILGPDISWTVPYKADFSAKDYAVNAQAANYGGASLRAFVKLGKQKGYRLAGCNRGGWNAFFVRTGLGEDILPEVSVESCFRFGWNRLGIERRFPLVRDMKWEEV